MNLTNSADQVLYLVFRHYLILFTKIMCIIKSVLLCEFLCYFVMYYKILFFVFDGLRGEGDCLLSPRSATVYSWKIISASIQIIKNKFKSKQWKVGLRFI